MWSPRSSKAGTTVAIGRVGVPKKRRVALVTGVNFEEEWVFGSRWKQLDVGVFGAPALTEEGIKMALASGSLVAVRGILGWVALLTLVLGCFGSATLAQTTAS